MIRWRPIEQRRGSNTYHHGRHGVREHVNGYDCLSRCLPATLLTFPTEVERTLHTIFKRCVQCPNETPTCPDCPNGQICSLVPQSCDSCQHMLCIANPNGPPSGSGTSVGAIAGGVVGGLIFVAIAVVLMWRFHVRKRRQQQEMEGWENDTIARHKALHPGGGFASDAASTRTRGSIAQSFMSRASNIIQIAYFPGVTGRSGSSHNSLAPVPPIPAMYAQNSPKSPLQNDGDMLFFRPGSTYSATSSRSGNRDTQYTQFSRQSITPSLARQSMASEVYRDDATVEPMPATKVLRLAPRMVSVKSSPLATPAETPNPSNGENTIKIMVPGQGTAPTAMSGGMSVKATQVTVGGKGKGKGRFPVRSPSDDSTLRSGRRTPTVSSPLIETNTLDSEDDDQDEHARARQSLIKPSIDTGSPSSPLRQPIQSPFFDASELQTPPASTATRPNPYAAMSSTVASSSPPSSSPRRTGQKPFGGLGAVIEEATKKASSVDSADKKRDLSPFADEHATE